jgi:protein involved in polysaccharide export with SLBB domain
MKKLLFIAFMFAALLQTSAVSAQDLMKAQDLSTLKVDFLSDTDLAKIRTQLESNKITIDQAEQLALSKGMSASEFAKLKARLGMKSAPSPVSSTKSKLKKNMNSFESTDTIAKDDYERKYEKIINKKVKDSLNALVFGSELFDNPTLNFEPNLKLATPVNYVLGPGDELQISVYGIQEFSDAVPVTVEGKVNIQYVGQIAVSGMTIEAATVKIKNAIARVYSTVRSGQSQVGISLSRIRTIKVTLIGSKQPGNYSVSSLSTVYNALFMGGGPAKNGSYRNIELIRNNKVYRTIDLYRFLVNGNQSDNIGLKDNDVIRIPAYSQRVTVEGEVKRPGIFEMKSGESFQDLLAFASGFNEFAFTASVNVLQKTDKEYKVKDVKAAEFKLYKPRSGDLFTVSKILNRFENRIKIEGAVFRPSTYSFYEGMRIADLVAKADGLKEDAYTARATIVRLKSDFTKEAVAVNLGKALQGDVQSNILLKKEDIVTVYSILDFKEEYKVTIDGEIKNPGEYDYNPALTLNDLLVQAGGLTGSASKRVEVARMIQAEEIELNSSARAELFNIEITPGNNEQAENFVLAPFDVINIRRMAVYEKPEMVSVSGSVKFPGKYVLANKKEKVFSVLQRAGGLTPLADIRGVKIKRPIKAKQIEELESVNFDVDKNVLDEAVVKKDTVKNKALKKLKEELKFATIPLDWDKIVKNPNNRTNVILMPGDEIEVAEFSESVKVTGSVLLTSEIPYNSGRGLGYYLSAVGGTDAKAWKRKAYVIYPNGQAAVTGSFLFFKHYPKVTQGSQIVVPEKPLTKKMTTGEWVSIGSVITSLSLLILNTFR